MTKSRRFNQLISIVLLMALILSLFFYSFIQQVSADDYNYTVTIDLIDGYKKAEKNTHLDIYSVPKGKSASYKASVYYDKDNKIFAGLYTDKDGQGERVIDLITSENHDEENYQGMYFFETTPTEDITYYAFYDDPITVTFNANGGSFWDSSTIIEEKRPTNIRYIKDHAWGNTRYNVDEVKRDGYIFKGWSEDKSAANGLYASDLVLTNKYDITLFAIWEDPNAPDPSDTYELPDGLNQIDGEWVYIRNQKIDTNFSGLVKHDKDYWYIENGKANFEYTGLVNSNEIENYDTNWYWVTKGVFDKTHNGAEPYLDRGTYLVENGYIDFHKTTVYHNEKTNQWMVFINGLFSKNANGIYQNKYGWWKATNGIVNFKENGVFQNSFGWWRVKDSKVDFNAQGIYQNNFGWWKTTNGKVTFKENGVFQNEFGWWKVKDSKVDFSFTGIASNKYGSWYIKGGKVDFNKNGKVNYNGKTYTIKNGQVV